MEEVGSWREWRVAGWEVIRAEGGMRRGDLGRRAKGKGSWITGKLNRRGARKEGAGRKGSCMGREERKGAGGELEGRGAKVVGSRKGRELEGT